MRRGRTAVAPRSDQPRHSTPAFAVEPPRCINPSVVHRPLLPCNLRRCKVLVPGRRVHGSASGDFARSRGKQPEQRYESALVTCLKAYHAP